MKDGVQTHGFTNTYTIETGFGTTIEVHGDEMLPARVHEIVVHVNLLEVMKGLVYAEAIKKSIPADRTVKKVVFWLSGKVSPRLRQEAESRGFEIVENVRDRLTAN